MPTEHEWEYAAKGCDNRWFPWGNELPRYEFVSPDKDYHAPVKAWVEGWHFREYDPSRVNNRLKGLDYKKTEWDKIKHDNYKIIEDKYRKR